MLDPLIRDLRAELDRSLKQNREQLALATFAGADRADKTALTPRALSDPRRKPPPAARVEEVLQIERRKGRDFDRETVYKFILGEEAEKSMSGRSSSQARQAGQQRIASQQARTTGGRGDTRRDDRPRRYAANDMSPEAVRQRLEGPDAYI